MGACLHGKMSVEKIQEDQSKVFFFSRHLLIHELLDLFSFLGYHRANAPKVGSEEKHPRKTKNT